MDCKNPSFRFCECGDLQVRLAVLGVISQDTAENAALRTVNRNTWMRGGTQSGILARFVMRGIGLSARALQEARAHGDTVFVSAPSVTSYKTAPLRSLLGWLRCAHAAWPHARLIGKADDDVAVMATRVALHLHATLTALEQPRAGEALGTRGGARGAGAARRLRPRLASPSLYWGMMETMHWDAQTHRPVPPFRFGFGFKEHCLRRRSPPGYAWRNGSFFTNKARKLFWRPPGRSADEALLLPAHAADVWRDRHHAPPDEQPEGLFVGPLPFAKGPLYFMSRELAAQLSGDRALRRDAAVTISSALNTTYREPTWPWEDIYTGLALTQVATSPQPLVAVHIGNDAFLESFSMGRGPGLVLKETMLLWHERGKRAKQMRAAHEWAHAQGCNVSSLRLTCSEVKSCAGTAWWLCSAGHKDTSYEQPGCSAALRGADGREAPVRWGG